MGFRSKIKMHGKEWATMFHQPGKGTGMNNEEALEIVLGLARGVEWSEELDWEDSYAEACGIIDGMLADMATE